MSSHEVFLYSSHEVFLYSNEEGVRKDIEQKLRNRPNVVIDVGSIKENPSKGAVEFWVRYKTLPSLKKIVQDVSQVVGSMGYYIRNSAYGGAYIPGGKTDESLSYISFDVW